MTSDDLEIFELTAGEKTHPLWLRLKAWAEYRLQVKRGRNDDPTLTADQTAALRGEIQTLKSLIALGDEPPPIVDGAEGGPR